MKKIIYIFFTALIGLLQFSCSEDFLDKINKNPDNPTQINTKYIIPDAIVATAFSVASGDFCFYSSVYMEHNVGIYAQMYNADIRVNEPTNSTTYNNTWGTLYANLRALNDIITKCSEDGNESGNYVTLGIAQILTAYNLAALTDVMGDVPWSEALQLATIKQPKLDKQEEIYNNIFILLNTAIENLDKTTTHPSLGTQDFLYGGDAKKWKKFAYGLLARYTMRLSHKKPNYAKVIEYADKSFADASEQAQFKYNGTTTQSPFYRFFKDRNYYGCSKSMKAKTDSRSDPRASKFYVKYNATTDIVYATNGKPEQKQGRYGISGLSTITAPTYLLSYHEIEFLKAEAYYRSSPSDESNAKTAVGKAITAAFAKVNIGLESSAAAYITTQITPKTSIELLKEIQVQKYLAFYEEEALEAYNDYRRWQAMDEDNCGVVLSNPLNSSKFPHRFVYGVDDVATNPNISSVVGDGQYVYTQKVWWAGGSN